MHVNVFYHRAIVSGLAMRYSRLRKIAVEGAPNKLDFTARDVGMVVVDVALAMATTYILIKQGSFLQMF